MENLEEINLVLTPLTKELLTNYISLTYEDNADYSDDSLRAELMRLKNENNLEQLFFAEMIANNEE